MLEQVDDVSLTTDMLTSDSNKSYLSVTIHFILDSTLKSLILATVEVESEHSASNIADALKKVTHEWSISKKIVAYVTDNASTMKTAISEHLGKRNQYCVVHTLNLAVKDCISPKDTDVQDRHCNIITDLLAKCRSIVCNGHIFKEIFLSCQLS